MPTPEERITALEIAFKSGFTEILTEIRHSKEGMEKLTTKLIGVDQNSGVLGMQEERIRKLEDFKSAFLGIWATITTALLVLKETAEFIKSWKH